jgi:hypothetical protein
LYSEKTCFADQYSKISENAQKERRKDNTEHVFQEYAKEDEKRSPRTLPSGMSHHRRGGPGPWEN